LRHVKLAFKSLLLPSSELFDNVLETACTDDNSENAITARRFLMEIGGINGKLVESWNVRSWPTIIVIDMDGKIVTRGISAASLPNLIE